MRIVEINVRGLFGFLNHDLRFREDERVTIIVGPNGVGKTIMLKMINAIFTQSLRSLSKLPFEQMIVHFDNGTKLVADRVATSEDEEDKLYSVTLTLQGLLGAMAAPFTVQPLDAQTLSTYASMIENTITTLRRLDETRWRNMRTNETLELEDVLERFGDQLPHLNIGPSVPNWLQEVRKSISVGLIDTERLMHTPRQNDVRRRVFDGGVGQERTVLLYALELRQRIQRTLGEYGSLSQALDRTFPVRVVEEPTDSAPDMARLREELTDIEAKREQLVQAGLLPPEQGGLGLHFLDDLDPSRRGVLAVYARDAKEKLGVFDDLLRRIDAFKRIANSRLISKTVTVGTEGLTVMGHGDSKLELDMLSSGEQHELVLLYELLFRVRDNSFILIDEPELSFHIDWQDAFLDDLEDIALISNFRVLVATHSPQIIGERWNLTISLNYPKS